MVKTEQLREIVEARGLKYKYLASEMKLSPYGLQKKINNDTEFKASEIEALSYLLKLSIVERDNIFFDSVLTYSQHKGA